MPSIDAEFLDGLQAKYADCAEPQEQRKQGNGAALPEPWPVMSPDAFYGLAGEVVRTISPHSEADPVALLIQFLTMAGSVVGRLPYWQVESDRHHANFFAVLVGATSRGRKGTSLGRISAVVRVADGAWVENRLKGGLSSGEGLIAEVRDPVQKWEPKENVFQTVDPGIADKRLMIVEPEFAALLEVTDRHGSTLSALIRRAWDGDKLQTITKNSPMCATGGHISIIGHISEDELRALVTKVGVANGFINRFAFLLVRRSKLLPHGGDLPETEIERLGRKLADVIEKVRTFGRIKMTPAARRQWETVYGALSEPHPGLLGMVTARADPLTARLALIYALLDGSNEIDEPHLRAALALWEYAEASAAHVFGNALGDPVADEILTALKQAGPSGMSRTAIRDLFGRNKSGDRIGAALKLLVLKGRAWMEMRQTAGRPTEIWFARAEAAHG